MRRYVVGRALSVLALVALALTSNAPTTARAQSTDVLAGVIEAGFEGGSTGWSGIKTQAPLDRPGMQRSGAKAAHLIASGTGAFSISTQYWLVPVSGRAEHRLSLWLYEDDPSTSNIKVKLEFLTSAGLPDAYAEFIDSGTAGWRQASISLINRESAAYAQVSVTADASAAGATLYVDDVSLQRGLTLPALPTPPPTAAPTVIATAQPTATTPPGASATAPPTNPPLTATSIPTPAPAAAYPGPFDGLTNGGFDDGL